jgi:hypothetical protein
MADISAPFHPPQHVRLDKGGGGGTEQVEQNLSSTNPCEYESENTLSYGGNGVRE